MYLHGVDEIDSIVWNDYGVMLFICERMVAKADV